jgi:hypothetical protein
MPRRGVLAKETFQRNVSKFCLTNPKLYAIILAVAEWRKVLFMALFAAFSRCRYTEPRAQGWQALRKRKRHEKKDTKNAKTKPLTY